MVEKFWPSFSGINLNINRYGTAGDVELECITFAEMCMMRNQSRLSLKQDLSCVSFSSSGFGDRETSKCVNFMVK